jgi:hypothetical protein
MKLTRALVASTFFVAILIGVYYFNVNFLKVNVVFYAAIVDGIVAALATGVILVVFRYFRVLGGFEKFQLVVIWLLVGYAFAISVPTVIDRSLSFYILEKLQQRGGGIKQDSFEQVFTQEYVKEHHLVDVRLTEQLESGTIIVREGCVTLTEKGKMIASFGRYFRTHWLPKQRLLMGKYSDDLTDPFRHSVADVNYECQPR